MTLPSSVSSMDALTLSKYDDLLSDVLLDQVGLWFATRKMFPRYRTARVSTASTVELVRRVAHKKLPLADAVDQLLLDEYVAAFLRLKTPRQVSDFRLHAGRYLSMYLPEAGYEIGQTERYKVVTGTSEAKVVATKRYTLGMVINLCSGSVAILNDREIQRMEREHVDFSVMWWTKKKSMCLFLGPARFVNHDCDSNCQFTALGSDAICFQALRTIEPGDEITTNYGSDYFGPSNCECLCATCEKYGRGWYAPQEAESEGIAHMSPADTDTESIAGDLALARMRTRNKGLRSVTPRSCLPAKSRNTSDADGTPVCANCSDSCDLQPALLQPPATPDSVGQTPAAASKKTQRVLCRRCTRHEFLFNCVWPGRPQQPRKRIAKRNSNKRSLHESRRPGEKEGGGGGGEGEGENRGSTSKRTAFKTVPKKAKKPRVPTIFDGAQGPVDASAAQMFASRMNGTPVLVDPLEDASPVSKWWPGVIVDCQKKDESTPIYRVRFFEDGSYASCGAHEMVLLDPKNSLEAQSLLGDHAKRRALAYYEWRFLAPLRKGLKENHDDSLIIGVNETAMLRELRPTDALATAPAADMDPEIAFDDFFGTDTTGGSRRSRECVRAYLHVIGDTVRSIDARDCKPYQARVVDIEFLNNAGRFGLHYYVHYLGWSTKFDEWVPPSRIVNK
ncbi:histone lysine methyltransferase Set9 [Coemansia sp. RSA 1813]|nr:histone lysine methyltransferase Set9 [Coemansia sp. RSA 1646]KAJ1769983.1 histone lysine methyltransferase Set9 [Coemansia sp. RSA 1843]KAJ2088107.1 histone lysine methyltransferase Set9 [Coemansia sp. RSA 986]KAJ2214831.1 histone lysine methyltransferase Set9 [Coemansia sp. RSA 487]KAJ2567840.1 histone lysine methyltransferase Set9 [Coemansia sp. RSA 1813]